MEKIFNNLYEKIKTNKKNKDEGKQNSIVFPFTRFSEMFPGWEKGKYYLVTANSGIGKTKLAKFLSITTVYEFIKNNSHLKYKIFYFALEETKEDFWLGVISTILYEKYEIDISPSQLKSLGNFKLEDHVLEKIAECEHIVTDMEKYIEVIDHVSNPTGIYKQVKRYFDSPEIGKEIQDVNNTEAKGYEYADENLWVFVITDHISLLTQETIESSRLSLHETMGLFSKQYCLKKFCKKYQCITINIQQQESAKEKQEFYRGETIEEKLEPSLDGLANNKECQRDNQNIALFNNLLYFCFMRLKWNLNKALLLRESGYRYSEIARELGIKEQTVQHYFWKHYGKTNVATNTAKRTELTQLQKEVFFGTLLGDANLTLTKANAWGKIEHSTKQKDYVEYKKNILHNFSSDVKNIERFDKRTKKTYCSSYFNMNANQSLTDFYHLFYEGGKKKIPEDLNLLTPVAIAIWYMDDGSKSSSGGYYFCTNCFTKEDINRLRSYLLLKYNIETSLHKGNMIYVPIKSTIVLKSLIQNYIIESMQYKL